MVGALLDVLVNKHRETAGAGVSMATRPIQHVGIGGRRSLSAHALSRRERAKEEDDAAGEQRRPSSASKMLYVGVCCIWLISCCLRCVILGIRALLSVSFAHAVHRCGSRAVCCGTGYY